MFLCCRENALHCTGFQKYIIVPADAGGVVFYHEKGICSSAGVRITVQSEPVLSSKGSRTRQVESSCMIP